MLNAPGETAGIGRSGAARQRGASPAKEGKSSPKSSNYNLITSNSGFPEPIEGMTGLAP